MALSQRKRKRAKARGDRPEAPQVAGGRGKLSADWSAASAEDAALIRQAVRENWPVEHGDAILESLTSAISPVDRPRQMLRVAQLFIAIENRNLEDLRRELFAQTSCDETTGLKNPVANPSA